MVDFSNVAKQVVTDQDTVEYELADLDMEGETAVLTVCPATRSNKAYQASLAAKTASDQTRGQSTKAKIKLMNKLRDIQREIFPTHIIRGWRNVLDAEGNLVPYSKENCEAFMKILPTQVFDGLAAFCEDEANFRDFDSDEVAGN